MPRPSRTLLLAAPLLSLLACDPDAPPSAPDAATPHVPRPFVPTEATRAYCGRDDADALEARITELLAELSLDEKIAMMHGESPSLVGQSWRVAGNERLGIAGLHMLDGPRGVSAFTGVPATAFPVAMMRGATWDPELEARVGAAIAREVRSLGVDVLLAPTMNLLRHPRWGRAQETYSEDGHHMAEMALGFVRGVQSEGVMASAKHFALNSIENTRHTVDVQADERTLREVYLPHFRRVVQEGRVASVMSAYNRVLGRYADQSTLLLRDVLKGEWQFAGFVESDWFFGTHGDAESVLAGLDVEMPTGGRFRRLPVAIARGELSEHDVDDSVRRILRAQLCFDTASWSHDIDDASARLTPEHLALAREVARRGIVLLRNEPPRDAAPEAPAVLPLDPSDPRPVVVLGRLADVENIGDRGSSRVVPHEVVTALEGLRARLGEARVIHATTLDAATEAAVREAAAVIVVTGLGEADEGEASIGAGDRASLALAAEEVALIRQVTALSSRVAVVLEGGAAIITSDWEDEVAALLFAFYPGTEGGHALAEVLVGDAFPSGRLPFSIPRAEEDLPPFDNTSETVTYDFFHGYRHLAHHGRAPAHAFGAGLGYTRFAYDDLQVEPRREGQDAVQLSVRVRNEGDRPGIETVQAYVTARGSAVPRAPRDLRAFAQVELEPGQQARVALSIAVDDLAYWSEEAHRFVLEPIAYEVVVARDAVAEGLSAPLPLD